MEGLDLLLSLARLVGRGLRSSESMDMPPCESEAEVSEEPWWCFERVWVGA